VFRLVVLRHVDAVSPDGSEGAALATGRAPVVRARVLVNACATTEDAVSTRADTATPEDQVLMQRAIALAATARTRTSPNPWVGCVVEAADGGTFDGATEPPGGPHAEVVALRAAGDAARGATLVTTLEPCSHHGRTPPCVDAVIAAGIARVVVGIEDPDPHVRGQGIAQLRAAGIEVTVDVCGSEVRAQLAPYLKHRLTGKPYVVLKLAGTLDGRTAAPDGTSQWITGEAARRDAHRLRAESDAVIVGAGTVRADDPSLTVRHVEGRDPMRVVLGHAPTGAKVLPALELQGDLGVVLDELGRQGVVQAMVEGGATVAAAFHRAGLVDRYVLYLAPALFGGDDGRPLFTGDGAATIGDLWRGRLISVDRLGDDLRLELEPA
jgi:diaminohydroxyphosphoribosylaminopyrimidine deaminase / 5-amino-6-(5-phosphoribosylamino)uracil reductase